jgi:hypothetical protein
MNQFSELFQRASWAHMKQSFLSWFEKCGSVEHLFIRWIQFKLSCALCCTAIHVQIFNLKQPPNIFQVRAKIEAGPGTGIAGTNGIVALLVADAWRSETLVAALRIEIHPYFAQDQNAMQQISERLSIQYALLSQSTYRNKTGH